MSLKVTLHNNDIDECLDIDCAYDNKTAAGCDGATIYVYTQYMTNQASGVINHENDYAYLNDNPNLVCQDVV